MAALWHPAIAALVHPCTADAAGRATLGAVADGSDEYPGLIIDSVPGSETISTSACVWRKRDNKGLGFMLQT
jgi:hypothetical protein